MLTAKLARTKTAAPTSARTSPSENPTPSLSRSHNHPASATKIAAKFASSVALATVVNLIDQCQNARSPANSTPGIPSRSQSRRFGARRAPGRPGDPRCSSTWAQKIGDAIAMRHIAVADGPRPRFIAIRVRTGANPIAAAPNSSAASATRGLTLR